MYSRHLCSGDTFTESLLRGNSHWLGLGTFAVGMLTLRAATRVERLVTRPSTLVQGETCREYQTTRRPSVGPRSCHASQRGRAGSNIRAFPAGNSRSTGRPWRTRRSRSSRSHRTSRASGPRRSSGRDISRDEFRSRYYHRAHRRARRYRGDCRSLARRWRWDCGPAVGRLDTGRTRARRRVCSDERQAQDLERVECLAPGCFCFSAKG